MSDSVLWGVATAAIAGLFGFAAVILWLLERASSVPPYRERVERGHGSATDAAIIVGGGLVMLSALLDPPSAPWIVALGLALVALGAVPFQRTPAARQGLRLAGLGLAIAVHVLHYAMQR